MKSTEELFARPSDFDSLDFVVRSLAATPRAYSLVVTLFTGAEQARQYLPASLGGASIEEREEGVLLRCTTDSPDWMARILAGLECDFIVHDPPELRAGLRQLANRLIDSAGGTLIE